MNTEKFMHTVPLKPETAVPDTMEVQKLSVDTSVYFDDHMCPGKDNRPEMVMAAGLLLRHPLLADGSAYIYGGAVEDHPEGIFTWHQTDEYGYDNQWILVERIARIPDTDEIVVLFNCGSGCDGFGYYDTVKDSQGRYHPTDIYNWDYNKKVFIKAGENRSYDDGYYVTGADLLERIQCHLVKHGIGDADSYAALQPVAKSVVTSEILGITSDTIFNPDMTLTPDAVSTFIDLASTAAGDSELGTGVRDQARGCLDQIVHNHHFDADTRRNAREALTK